MAKKKKHKSNRKPLYLAIAICAVTVFAMIIVLLTPKVGRGEFEPPPFEENAVSGTPTVDSHLGYSEIYSDQMSFRAWVCGKVAQSETTARLYFTNPPENNVWLKVRLIDAAGDIIGESGILKPGEYVESVALTKALRKGDDVVIKIMAYEIDTYHSEGAVTLRPLISE